MKDFLMSVNKFEKPVVVSDKDAIYVLLIRLMRLNPGDIQIHPDMGVGIVEKWRYISMDKLYMLEETIQEQIEKFLPMLQGAKVSVRQSKGDPKAIVIDIVLDKSLFKFKANEKEVTLADAED